MRSLVCIVQCSRMNMDLNLRVSTMYILLLAVSTTTAHVALRYPATRFPPLDFLKTSKTPEPCGVPRLSDAQFQTFYTNTSYNFTFRIAYPHQGGYRLSLWDENDRLVQGLWPLLYDDGFAGLDDQTTQRSDNIVFPKPCPKCFVRLERQAIEKDDVFQSCADVNVIDGQPHSGRQQCSDAGEFVDGLCQCDHLRSGPICQYIDYCTNNTDCLNGGQCIEAEHGFTRRTCFCAFGYFGINCERSDTHHIIPGSASTLCFNRDYPDNESQFELYGLFNESCYQVEKLNKDDTLYYRILGSNTWISIGWRPIDIDASCRLFPVGPNSLTEVNQTAQNTNTPTGATGATILHPMNCLDLIIGYTQNGLVRIADHYTRDQSTPLQDSWYNGNESLTAAYGINLDGRTVIMFRRSIEATEPADHNIGPGETFVVWAKGQELGHYFHVPKSALEASEVGDPVFYKSHTLLYHGKRNRGIHTMAFVDPNSAPPIIGVSLSLLLFSFYLTLLYQS